MKQLFEKNDIKPNEIKENPQAFISILHGLEKETEVPENELMTDSDFKKEVQKIEFIPSNPNEIYRFAKQLGKGAMCTVYEAYHRKRQTECVAVRVMKVPDNEMLDKIKIEAAVMSMCANKNIVNYISSYFYMNCLFMLIEFMDGGSLTDIVYAYTKRIP
jgi:serine/threonine protein kinase